MDRKNNRFETVSGACKEMHRFLGQIHAFAQNSHNFSHKPTTKRNHQEGGADRSRTMDENFDPSRNMKTAMQFFQSGVQCSAGLKSSGAKTACAKA
jgi:hypothetical protein